MAGNHIPICFVMECTVGEFCVLATTTRSVFSRRFRMFLANLFGLCLPTVRHDSEMRRKNQKRTGNLNSCCPDLYREIMVPVSPSAVLRHISPVVCRSTPAVLCIGSPASADKTTVTIGRFEIRILGVVSQANDFSRNLSILSLSATVGQRTLHTNHRVFNGVWNGIEIPFVTI